MLARDDLAEYIAMNYGVCNRIICRCLKDGWLGYGCPHWEPAKARNWDELRAEQEYLYR